MRVNHTIIRIGPQSRQSELGQCLGRTHSSCRRLSHPLNKNDLNTNNNNNYYSQQKHCVGACAYNSDMPIIIHCRLPMKSLRESYNGRMLWLIILHVSRPKCLHKIITTLKTEDSSPLHITYLKAIHTFYTDLVLFVEEAVILAERTWSCLTKDWRCRPAERLAGILLM